MRDCISCWMGLADSGDMRHRGNIVLVLLRQIHSKRRYLSPNFLHRLQLPMRPNILVKSLDLIRHLANLLGGLGGDVPCAGSGSCRHLLGRWLCPQLPSQRRFQRPGLPRELGGGLVCSHERRRTWKKTQNACTTEAMLRGEPQRPRSTGAVRDHGVLQ